MLKEPDAACPGQQENDRKLRVMEHEMQRVTRELAAMAILQDEQRAQIAALQERMAVLNHDRRHYRDKLRRREAQLLKTELNLRRMCQSRLWRWTEPLRRLRRFSSSRLQHFHRLAGKG